MHVGEPQVARAEREVLSAVSVETALRRRLGIPLDAPEVLVLAESTHWDPNWLFTSEEIYAGRVAPTLRRVLRELADDPARIFSIECLFFLQMHWERCPESRDALRALLDAGRLRLTGTGVTTPDTLVPTGEALVRDFLRGQEWLRLRGIRQEPTLAYFPDSFGHSPELPALLRSLGMDKAVVTRIDGMFFPGADLRPAGHWPRPGSSAERLLHHARSLDFVWHASDGSEVLAHWNAFTYAQGDMLAHAGLTRWMGLPLAVPARSRHHVDGRVASYVEALRPLARTPYMLCPIGFDFAFPIPRLGELIAAYNDASYPRTGVFVVNAGMDDYLALVGTRRDDLPTLSLDPNPYWMGFYASRGSIKRRARAAEARLLEAERDVASAPFDPESGARVDAAWDRLVVTNHHDFVTGTSPDRVAHGEQADWLDDIERDVAALAPAPPRAKAARAPSHPVEWSREGDRLHVRTASLAVTVDAARGGAITSWRVPGLGDLARGALNDLVVYEDSGGLWRMGHELRGGVFRPRFRASEHRADVVALASDGGVEVQIGIACEGRMLRRWLRFDGDSPLVRMRIEGSIARRRTLVCAFASTLAHGALRTEVAGGVVERPLRKLFDPTFWPVAEWASCTSLTRGASLGVMLGGPAGVHVDEEGTVAWPVLRNANHERALGVLPLLAFPAWGTEDGPGVLEYAVAFTPAAPDAATGDAAMARLAASWRDADGASSPLSIAASDARTAVLLRAYKWASRGDGRIARLAAYGALPCDVAVTPARGRLVRAVACDARERDLADVQLVNGAAHLRLAHATTTLRLFVDDDFSGGA